jgi:hypothetical protein
MNHFSTNYHDMQNHFIKMAQGYKPQKKKDINLFTSQVGSGSENSDNIQMVTPTAQATEQAKVDLKRGLDQTDVLDNAINQDVKRRKQSLSSKRQKKRTNKSKKRTANCKKKVSKSNKKLKQKKSRKSKSKKSKSKIKKRKVSSKKKTRKTKRKPSKKIKGKKIKRN